MRHFRNDLNMTKQIMPPPPVDDTADDVLEVYAEYNNQTNQFMPIPSDLYDDEEITESDTDVIKEDHRSVELFPGIKITPFRKADISPCSSNQHPKALDEQISKPTIKRKVDGTDILHQKSRCCPIKTVSQDKYSASTGNDEGTKVLIRRRSVLFDSFRGYVTEYATVLFTLICLVSGNESGEQWQYDNRIIFGENISLNLFIPTDIPGPVNSTSFWRGGPSKKLLAYENVSANRRKYDAKVTRNDSYSVHSLVIQNVSEKDFDCQYSFHQGFEKYHTNLTSMNKTFERHPNNNTIDDFIYEKDQRLFGQVVIGSENGVYPSPDCDFLYGKVSLEAEDIVKHESETSFASLRVVYSFNTSVKRTDYCDNLSMICLIGNFQMSLEFVVNNCTDKIPDNTHTNDVQVVSTIIGTAFVVLVLLAIPAGFKFAKTKGQGQNFENNDSVEEEKMLSETGLNIFKNVKSHSNTT